jgi:hypothetical protein
VRDAELPPEQDEQVRRLLAEARHDEPIPAAVADRLDRVLADLSRDEPSEHVAPVVDLTARRRRRHAAALLAGAAAVIVGGFAVGQVIDVGDADNAAGGAAQEPVNRDEGAGGSGDLADSSGAGEEAAPSTQADSPMKLTSDNLQRDLLEQLPSAEAGTVDKESASQAVRTFGCRPSAASAYGRGTFFPAFYDGVPAVVALRPPAGDTQRADVLECASAAELASAVIASR